MVRVNHNVSEWKTVYRLDSNEMSPLRLTNSVLQGSSFRWYMQGKQKYSLKKGIKNMIG